MCERLKTWCQFVKTEFDAIGLKGRAEGSYKKPNGKYFSFDVYDAEPAKK